MELFFIRLDPAWVSICFSDEMEWGRIINIWSNSQRSSCADRTHGCHQVLVVTPTLHLVLHQNLKGRLKGTVFPKSAGGS